MRAPNSSNETKFKADRYFRDQSVRLGERVDTYTDPFTAFMRYHDITQAQFAARIPIGHSNIRNWIRGCRIKPSRLDAVGSAMGIRDPERLRDRSRWPEIIREITGEMTPQHNEAALQVEGDRVRVKINGLYSRAVAAKLLDLASS